MPAAANNLPRIAARLARGALASSALAYGVGVAALAVLWATSAKQTWWLELSNIFALYLFAPLLLLAPAALAVRSLRLRGGTAMACAVFLALFGSRLLPPAGAPPAGHVLRVATYNQLFSNWHVDDIVALIRAQDADVVAIQELSWRVADAVAEQLRDVYPYQELKPQHPYGLGLLSRYPMRDEGHHVVLERQRVVLDVAGQAVTLINVHLTSPSIETFTPRGPYRVVLPSGYSAGWRGMEEPFLLKEIDSIAGPLVVMGDFNTGDREPLYRELDARLHDAYAESAWGFGATYPNKRMELGVRWPFPLVRIDYVWSRGGVLPAGARTECSSAGSDHCMVIAELRVARAEPSAAGRAAYERGW